MAAIKKIDQAAAAKRLREEGWREVEGGWLDPHGGTRSYRNEIGQHTYPSGERIYTAEEALAHQDGYDAEDRIREREAQERDHKAALAKKRIRKELGID